MTENFLADGPIKLRSRLRTATFGYAMVPVEWVEAAAKDLERLHTAGLQLGDRVRVNDTCPYQELIGNESFVAGMTMQPDLTIDLWLTDTWPPQRGGEDGWSPSQLDRIPHP